MQIHYRIFGYLIYFKLYDGKSLLLLFTLRQSVTFSMGRRLCTLVCAVFFVYLIK